MILEKCDSVRKIIPEKNIKKEKKKKKSTLQE